MNCLTLFVSLFLILGSYLLLVQSSLESDKLWYQEKLALHEVKSFIPIQGHVLRLYPGEDLLDSIFKYARVLNVTSASVINAVGSLTTTNIRYANQDDGTSLTGHFEIVSLVGTIDYQYANNETIDNGSGHIHISCSDEKGVTYGGHLLSGNIIYTTAEITLLTYDQTYFLRQLDNGPTGSGYYELKVYP